MCLVAHIIGTLQSNWKSPAKELCLLNKSPKYSMIILVTENLILDITFRVNCVHFDTTVEALLTDTLVSGQLYL